MEVYIVFTWAKTVTDITNNTRVSVDNHNRGIFFN